MSEDEKALAKRKTELAGYGGRDALAELGQRLRDFMPGAQQFTEFEAFAVAQIALAHDLDAFNGEVWGIKSSAGKWYGVMVGIKGLRKSARRQAREAGGSYWGELIRVDAGEYGEQDSAAVYEYHLRTSETMNAWRDLVHSLVTDGFKASEAREMVGPSPVTIGLGIGIAGEASKMSLHGRARKRAEADALKMAFDVHFAGASVDAQRLEAGGPMVQVNGEETTFRVPSDQDVDAITADVKKPAPSKIEVKDFNVVLPKKEVTQPEPPDVDPLWNPAEPVSTVDPAAAAGIKRPIPPEQLKGVLELWAEMYKSQPAQPKDRHQLAAFLTTNCGGDKTKRYEFSKFYFGHSSTKDIPDAMVLAALRTWMGMTNWGGIPTVESIAETRSGLTYALEQLGQIKLGLEGE